MAYFWLSGMVQVRGDADQLGTTRWSEVRSGTLGLEQFDELASH
jgi:hypothetical protein